MPRKTLEVAISPSVLEWARKAAGYSEDAVATQLGVPRERVVAWEEKPGESRLTVRQLEELAQFYRRPLATLLLSEPPSEPAPPRDFRYPVKPDAPFSPSLRLAIRRARRLQRLAREMMEALGLAFTTKIPQATLHDDPENLAAAERETLGVTVEDQMGWRKSREALREWRALLEGRGVLTLQADFSREEAQGFSLSESHPYAIVVTADDAYTARCFTLCHEYAHLLLREGGVCLTEEALPKGRNSATELETWCHRFAEALLLPEEALQGRPEAEAFISQVPGDEQALDRLASLFKVSRAVVLFRLWHIGWISEQRFWTEYRRVQERGQEEAAQRQRKRRREGYAPPYYLAVQARGNLFSRLVLESLDRQLISYADFADYLGLRVKHLDRLRQALYG